MKVCLINPPAPWANEPAMNPQLGLCYVSAALKSQGYEVEGLDFSAMKFNYEHNIYLLKIHKADVYGIYCMSSQFHWVKEICQFIKASHPDSKIFVGGPHATCCPNDFLDLADHIVQGYGDFAINDILTGITHRLYHQNIIPDRSLFNQYEYHRTINGEKALHINTLRGCPYSCNYCDKESVGKSVYYRPIDAVLEEIDMLMYEYNTRSFVIYDDIFTLRRDRAWEFCKEFKKRNLQWRCWARTDLVDEELLSLMKYSGLTSITFGAESGDRNVLKNINKKATVSDNYTTLLMCQSIGIPVRCSLMFGNPGECEKSLLNTIDMIRFCTPEEWNLSILTPTPGSAFWNYPEKYGIKFDKQAIIDGEYQALNRFQDTGIGNIICSIDSCPDEELKELLPWFLFELEKASPRKIIQDTIQILKV